MSTVTYRYENNLTKTGKDGVKITFKTNLIDGAKGLSFSLLIKEGEKSFYRVSGKEVEKGKFEVEEKINDDITKSEMSSADLIKFIKSKKGDLDFVESYIKNDRSKYQAGGAKKGKKPSKKGSKASKKASKKVSKKAKKGSKKAKKGSKASKKVSKKGSKKAKKGSKASKTTKKGSKVSKTAKKRK